MKTTMKIAVIAMMGMSLTSYGQDTYFTGNSLYKGISWQPIKPRFFSYGGYGSDAKWFLNNIPEEGGRFLVIAGPSGQNGSSHIAFSIEGNKDAIFNGNVRANKGLSSSSQSGHLGLRIERSPSLFHQITHDSGKTIIFNGDNDIQYRFGQVTKLTLKNDGGANFGGNVGIGTTSPSAKLEISHDENIRTVKINPQNQLDVTGNSSLTIKEFVPSIEFSDSSNSSSAAVVFANNSSFFIGKKSGVRMTNSELFNVNLNSGKVGIGTLTTGSHKLAVEGSIGAREIKVEAAPNWSDFVFYDNYKLPTLIEVENYIKENGHLKDIPSAKEVEENGFYLGEMDSKLLQKIEELTLYTIDQEKKINAQRKEINELKKQKNKIEEQQEKIEKLESLVQKLLKGKN